MSLFSMLKQGREEKREAAKAAAQEAFWSWFQDNTAFLETYAEDTSTVIAAVGKRLDSVSRDLAFEMGLADDGIYEFIVSAEGIRAVFPEVIALTKAAPSILGWRIIAFRPRKPGGLGQVVRFEGTELGTGALWYRADRREEKLDLALAIEGQDKDSAHGLLGPVFLLLDAALGEYDVTTRIGVIEFDDCPADPAAAGLSPLVDLAAEVDRTFDAAEA